MVFLTGCASNYGYKPGTGASEDHQRYDLDTCRDKAWDAYFNSNHEATIRPVTFIPIGGSVLAGLAVGIGGTVLSAVASNATAEHSKSGPIMKKEDTDLLVSKCMSSKGYIAKG